MKKSLICPVCSSKKNEFAFIANNSHGNNIVSSKEEFKYYHCTACSAVFLTNVPFTSRYYACYYNFNGYYRTSSPLISFIESKLNDISYKKKEQKISDNFIFKNKKIKLLDVGAGEGSFMKRLNSSKYNATGIEIDKKSYLISKNNGMDIIYGDVITHNFGNKTFDVITLWHVIEHVPYPIKLMKKLRSLLTPKGIIVFATPNINSMGYKISQAKWYHTDAPRHVILYSKKSLEMLTSLTSTKIVKIMSDKYEFPLDLFWSTNGLVRFFSLFLKLFDQETITCIIKK